MISSGFFDLLIIRCKKSFGKFCTGAWEKSPENSTDICLVTALERLRLLHILKWLSNEPHITNHLIWGNSALRIKQIQEHVFSRLPTWELWVSSFSYFWVLFTTFWGAKFSWCVLMQALMELVMLMAVNQSMFFRCPTLRWVLSVHPYNDSTRKSHHPHQPPLQCYFPKGM